MPSAGTVLGAGSNQALLVSFTPTDSTDYTAGSFTAYIDVDTAQPSFSLSTASQSIDYGQATIILSGQLAAPTAIPTGEQVSIVIGSASGRSTVQSNGSFSAAIATNALSASSTPYTISYSYSGDLNFQSASDSSTTLTVNKATPTLNWPNPADIVYGAPLSSTQLDAAASVAGNFAYTPAASTLLKAGAGQTLLVNFTPTDTTDYTSTSATATINVDHAMLTITWAKPADIVYGTALSSTQLNATESIPGTFTYTPSAGTILHAGGGQTLSVNFTPTDRTDYAPVTAIATIGVTQATPVLSVSATGGAYSGTPFPAVATISSGIPGLNNTPAASLENVTPIVVYYDGASIAGASLGSPPPTSAGTYTVVAHFPGSTDYVAIDSAPLNFTINRATPVIALNSSEDSAAYGQAVTFTATVKAAGTPAGAVTFIAGGTTVLGTVALDGSGIARLGTSVLAVGSQSITASYSGDSNFNGVASAPAQQSIAKASTQAILVPKPVFKKKKLVSIGLTAAIEPVAPGGGVPTGKVMFELLQKHRKTLQVKLLGATTLTHGQALIALKPKQVLNKSITIVYNGDPDFQSTTVTSKLTQRSLSHSK
jgi:hypothetical protein